MGRPYGSRRACCAPHHEAGRASAAQRPGHHIGTSMGRTAKKPASPDLFDLPAPRAAPGRGKAPALTSRGASAGEGGYTAKHIEVLEGLEPVRRRPGMYIGGTDEKALHHLFA